ncbi:uncharacterized protein PHALS_06647 [Plasmopara halstedii]|uniref:Uncharacterized protein n=1 Tax=Plasmopara halstedii TaxID=4781 RepID=A0A0P1B4H8_PLAHL|nr:uncharacterized protein PHALS_06647 [Plasmopara halstedii]CEG48849.1 hypothetical protein PHALS_06647 [Plasmopara halstedii]|eukprot:XP_024585218.1 hypothetical protein PHALS_06647 [Plasmopara halstedii]
MQQRQPHRTRRREGDLESGSDVGMPQIPHIPPDHTTEHASDGMLGLLARHAEKQSPLHHQHKLHRKRQYLSQMPRPTVIPEAGASAWHPSTRQLEIDQDASNLFSTCNAESSQDDKVSLASPLVAFLGRPSKVESSRLNDNMMSPRSVWEESPLKEHLDPTASPRHTDTSNNQLVPIPHATSPWRIQHLLSPDPAVYVQPNTSPKLCIPQSPPRHSDIAFKNAKRPRLARRVSSQWRQDLSQRDRAKTRERIMRSLHMHCQGDYEQLVLILSSMDEELLHIKTTSNALYQQQACGLSDLVKNAKLER